MINLKGQSLKKTSNIQNMPVDITQRNMLRYFLSLITPQKVTMLNVRRLKPQRPCCNVDISTSCASYF